ncbi:hypothetical protein MAR_013932 [Mya arenaria]|uniref:Core-binding (CB) domain-containing protein n=1 Tax=Mya arenaria TaxID=6604 RepID=A0ABY7G1A3_MYAAR|nr:hypothetical protein MAR_013932 [Mya arenaria]
MAVADGLVNHALATSSTKTYNRALASYKSFLAKHTTDLPQTYPSPLRAILAFIAHCYINKLTASTTLTLLQAMYLLAFHAFLRVGELTGHGRGPAVVTYSCITFHYTADIPSALELHLENYNHSHGKTFKLLIPAKVSPVTTCPVAALWQFCKLRGSNPGPLFTFPDGSQVLELWAPSLQPHSLYL